MTKQRKKRREIFHYRYVTRACFIALSSTKLYSTLKAIFSRIHSHCHRRRHQRGRDQFSELRPQRSRVDDTVGFGTRSRLAQNDDNRKSTRTVHTSHRVRSRSKNKDRFVQVIETMFHEQKTVNHKLITTVLTRYLNAGIIRAGGWFARVANSRRWSDRRASYDRSRLSSESSFLFDGIQSSAQRLGRRRYISVSAKKKTWYRKRGNEKARRNRGRSEREEALEGRTRGETRDREGESGRSRTRAMVTERRSWKRKGEVRLVRAHRSPFFLLLLVEYVHTADCFAPRVLMSRNSLYFLFLFVNRKFVDTNFLNSQIVQYHEIHARTLNK